jgi:exosortase/archaeosortase family protein
VAASRPAGTANRQPSPVFRPLVFVGVFAAVFTLLQLALLLAGEAGPQRWLVDVGTVQAAGFIMAWLDPAAGVQAEGHRLVTATARLNVLRGCEGTELYFLWIAAVLAFPARRACRAWGLLGGLALAFGLNQARVIGLFYVVRDYPTAFALTHGYLAPLGLVLILGISFWWWSSQAAFR